MTIDRQDILNQVRKIYMREIPMFEEYEINNDIHFQRMGGIKVDGDDLSIFIEAVQKDFDFPMVQADLKGVCSLRDVANLVVKKLEEKQTPPTIEP